MSIELFTVPELLGTGEIITVKSDDGTVYFAASKLASALGYTRPNNAVATHVRERYKTTLGEIIPTPIRCRSDVHIGSRPNMIFLTESGVYNLIFKSNLPSAIKFQDWVTEEVLPSIRKTGQYVLSGVMPAIDNVKDEGLRQLPEKERIEGRGKLKYKSDIVKDPKAVSRGKKGGLVAQENIRQTKKDLERKEFQVRDQEKEITELREKVLYLLVEIDELDEKIRELED
ncbi:Hypothetical predicted protein [Paramuricea clavata]|uniref:Uncharacterized protein n=1 Tax=Paramuricea clavata TaxID=317549 RepID=A0A7D9E749_PARCT|nr:Hypothetical predicted protein [Paramuricea clavata]